MRNRFACVCFTGCWWLCVSSFGAAFGTALAADATVTLQSHADRVEVLVDGQPFATYHTSPKLPKPYFWPVRAADGTILTRGLENPADHPHHKGVWVSIDEVNGIKFWAERGKIVNAKVELLEPRGNPAVFRVTNHWLGADDQPVVIETTTITIDARRLVTYDITFAAAGKPAVFEDTKEGLFGIRLDDPLRERQGGHVVNADGLEGTKACWGRTAAWVDYYGQKDGRTYGVAIFDHPDNPIRSRYHVRDYGLFSINPFGDRAYTSGQQPPSHVQLAPGKSIRFRYGLYIHDGDTRQGKVAETYDAWVKQKQG
jgi:hypothetical protein